MGSQFSMIFIHILSMPLLLCNFKLWFRVFLVKYVHAHTHTKHTQFFLLNHPSLPFNGSLFQLLFLLFLHFLPPFFLIKCYPCIPLPREEFYHALIPMISANPHVYEHAFSYFFSLVVANLFKTTIFILVFWAFFTLFNVYTT